MNSFIAFCLKLSSVILLSLFIFWISVRSYDLLYGYVLTSYEKSIEESLEKNIANNNTKPPKELKTSDLDKIVAISNIRRNYFLLFLAIFAGVLAIWARFNHEKQLKRIKEQMAQTEKQLENAEVQIKQTEKQLEHAKTQETQTNKQLGYAKIQIKQTEKQLTHTEKQIENSFIVNRNSRYARAVEMLEKDKSEVSYRGGLYTLGELMAEDNKAENVLYGETITDWLKSANVSPGLKTVAMKLLME